MKVVFTVPPLDTRPVEYDSMLDAEDGDLVAAEAAEHYFDNCDGWDSTWPLDFHIVAGGEDLGVFEVELEFDPVFEARRKA